MSAYEQPEKKIKSPEDLTRFLNSTACEELVAFLESLAESVKGLPNDAPHDGIEVPLVTGVNRLITR